MLLFAYYVGQVIFGKYFTRNRIGVEKRIQVTLRYNFQGCLLPASSCIDVSTVAVLAMTSSFLGNEAGRTDNACALSILSDAMRRS